MRTWKIDPAHSEVKFKVKHLLVSTVTGQFNSFDAEIITESEDFSTAKITFEADTDTIDTKNSQRDAHLRSADFFDAENHPKLTFVSRELRKISDTQFELSGDITIRGITRPVHLNVEYNGKAKGFDGLDVDGLDVAGFEITGQLNRFDFGLNWNAMTEAGGIVVSPDVKLEIFAEMKEVTGLSKAA